MTAREATHLDPWALQEALDGRVEAEAQAHLAECLRCRGELEAWRRLVAELDALEDPCPDERFVPQVLARIEAEPQLAPAPGFFSTLLVLIGGAAAALLALLFAVGPEALPQLAAGAGRALVGLVSADALLRAVAAALPSPVVLLFVAAQAALLLLLCFAWRRLAGGEAGTPTEVHP